MSFQINDKVVCVGNGNSGPKRAKNKTTSPNGRPQKGAIYVVEGCEMANFINAGYSLGLHLVGIPRLRNGNRVPWWAGNFRKLEDIREESRLKAQHPKRDTHPYVPFIKV